MSKQFAGTVSVVMVREALAAPLQQGWHLEALLKGTPFSTEIMQDENGRVPVQHYARFWRRLRRTIQDEFFLMDQRKMRPGSFAFMCSIAAQQATVRQGLEVALQFLALIFADKRAVLRTKQSMAAVVLREESIEPARAFTYFTFWMYIHGLTCWLANQRIPLLSVDLRCSEPEFTSDYRVMFSDNLRFDCAASKILFSADVLDVPIRRTAEDVQRFLRQAPNNIIVKYRDEQSLSSQVRRTLMNMEPQHWPDAVDLAEGLFMSVSTLRRRLNEEGQSYQRLKDGVRSSLAVKWLADEHYTFVDIASALGFADVSSFYKAFRKWTGTQPSHYRSILLEKNK
ncbi:AraC family transcriptional regulator [Denitrificimonas sp. JX-1]|uniref:AraC family transcriptional regulator n=1 Tax=Denitrificimonas halotolerans TaxID=3098930 RepID=A0ABU5GP42_9GAMM|nr:AraC family transcriptional regulator [Denitrificimonas sp. JX-1]MDY7218736.1 AraC family transcriptional regulator [Denitrificimonas sp. JX-1]